MKGTALSLGSCLAASAALLLGSRSAQAQDFGKAGNVSVAIERAFGFHFARRTTDPDGPTPSTSGSAGTVGFGWYQALTPIHTARGAFDVFVIDRLSLGGSLGAYAQQGGGGFLLSPRVGYSIPLGKMFTFWPRGGVTFVKQRDLELFGVSLEPMFVAWPRPNWGVLLGPTLDFDFAGSENDNTSVSEVSFGIPTVGLIASF